MSKRYLFSITFIGSFLLLTIFSCDKEPNCNADFNIDVALYDAEDAWIEADFVYFLSPTDANCKALKVAIDNYLDEASKIENCAKKTGKLDELNELTKEARDERDALPCA